MKERPILFSAPMVRATLRDVDPKTQTRRAVKFPSIVRDDRADHDTDATWNDATAAGWLNDHEDGLGFYAWMSDYPEEGSIPLPCPYGQPGDRLWGRETYFAFGRWETRFSAKKGRDEWHFVDMTLECGHEHAYAADGHSFAPHQRTAGASPCWWKRPAIFMPRAASRILLEVVAVRVERLQDISATDAIAEGIDLHPDHHHRPATSLYGPVQTYRNLWEQINGIGTWDANPWVWVVEFRRIKP